jgi:hypothetical protein
LLAAHRDPESYVAGATALNRDTPRFSALEDAAALQAAGYRVRWLRQLPMIYTASVSKDGTATRLEWVVDSDFRFFPTVRDEIFGYVLHPVDLAMNKAMAAAGRRELRDLIDLVSVHETILTLGAVVWAAVEKSPGFTPEGLIAEIRRNVQMPTDKAGLLFLKEGPAVQPDPARLGDYQTHAWQRRGQGPSSSEISTAMLESYKKLPAR